MKFSKHYQPRKKKKPRHRLPQGERQIPCLACYSVFGTPEYFTTIKNTIEREKK